MILFLALPACVLKGKRNSKEREKSGVARVKRVVTRLGRRLLRRMTHGELICELLRSGRPTGRSRSVWVETGCGLSTVALAAAAADGKAIVYSCDINSEKAEELAAACGERMNNVRFMIGDSLRQLEQVAEIEGQIDFLFLDSAASAMHTFREFLTVERYLHPGAQVLVDNAAIPGEWRLLSPVRKGKILVPYLLASPFWEVSGHPEAGDSMVSARMSESPEYADPDYEDPAYVDQWRARFTRDL